MLELDQIQSARRGDLLRRTADNPAPLADVDLAYLDATFFSEDECPGRDLTRIPHPFVGETMELLADRAASSPGTLRLMHFNHSNPVLHDPGLATSVVQRGFSIAEVGHCDPL